MSEVSIKSAFPLMYMIVFLYAIFDGLMGFFSSDVSQMTSSVNGEPNVEAIKAFLKIYAVVMAVYIFTYYVRLELFEHKKIIVSCLQNVGKGKIIGEFFIRISAAALVGLKILDTSELSNTIFFLLLMSLVILIWYVYMIYIIKTDVVSKIIMRMTLSIFFLASIMQGLDMADHQLYIWAIIIITTVLMVVAIAMIWCFLWEETTKICKNYLTEW